MEIEKLINVELNEVRFKLGEAMTYLRETDYVALKIAEALATGKDVSKLVSDYSLILAKREEYRKSIDSLREEEASILEGFE